MKLITYDEYHRVPHRLVEPAMKFLAFGKECETAVGMMFDWMYRLKGIGLAGPQVGLPFRIAVIDVSGGADPKAKIVLINPQLMSAKGEQFEEEGCLSLPGFFCKVKRPESVCVETKNAKGEESLIVGHDLLARALCHEIDHLNGKLIDDGKEWCVLI